MRNGVHIMTEVVNIKVEGVVDELILNSMQVLNQAFYQASAINQGKVESAKDYVISMLKPKG